MLSVAPRINRLRVEKERSHGGSHGIKRSKDADAIGKLFAVYLRRSDEGTLSRVLVELTIVLAAARNAGAILKEAATTYKVDTQAIAQKVRQEFAAREKTKKEAKPAPKPTAGKAKKAA